MASEYIATGMRTRIDDDGLHWVVNTCAPNDTTDPGDEKRWGWTTPTSRIMQHEYAGITAVSTECLWQGTKMTAGLERPDQDILDGNWRKAKGKKPRGAWAGEGVPLITTPGEARRRIYIPAFRAQIMRWLETSDEAAAMYEKAEAYEGRIYLRDYDTGQGLDRNGPMSHAWVLAIWLNTGSWPQ